MAVSETLDAGRARLGRAEALRLARSAKRVVAARGRKVVEFDMGRDAPSDAALLAVLLGPSGRLRAPVVRMGGTLLVGFNAEAYAKALR